MPTTNFIGVLIALVLLYGIPLGFVLTDPLVGWKERVLWVLATLWGSWLTCLVFLWIAPVFPRQRQISLGPKGNERHQPDRTIDGW